MKEAIRMGGGGGFIGFFLSSLALKTVGIYAGSIIFISFVIIGVLITFNSYLAKFFQRKGNRTAFALRDEDDSRVKISSEKLNLVSKIKEAVEKRREKRAKNLSGSGNGEDEAKNQKKLKRKQEKLLLLKMEARVLSLAGNCHLSLFWIKFPVSLMEEM